MLLSMVFLVVDVIFHFILRKIIHVYKTKSKEAQSGNSLHYTNKNIYIPNNTYNIINLN